MSDIFVEALKKLSIDQLTYILLGSWITFVALVIYFRIPAAIEVLLKRVKRIESNQRIMVDVITEFAEKSQVKLTEHKLEEPRDDEDL